MSCSAIISLKNKNKGAEESPELKAVRPNSRKKAGLRNGKTQ